MTPGYAMGYQEPMQYSRLQAFENGELDLDDVVILAQDIIEAGVLPVLSANYFHLAQHLVNVGFCTVTGRRLH